MRRKFDREGCKTVFFFNILRPEINIRIFDSEENKLIVGLPYGNELIVIAV